ncbi:hypothetical protein RND71_013042 [Anisodus tanguticus]|uniref:Uncharacterized protein n=1 Tax=Anisodus tanguticus TaxID=243964 RepID=A0AAE1VR83_9SOLA|nr:hypothetical protein RND71_013042 [Anisodus tanguticus]
MELLKPPSFRFGLLRQNFCPWNKARRWFYKFDILGFRKCCGPSAEAMKSLSGLMKLVKLEFERCPLIHGGLVHLEDLDKLVVLNLEGSDVTASCLDYLTGLTSLVSLNVSNSRITDDGLQYLKLLKNLHSLYLEFCGATACEIKKLQVTALQILRDTALINDILDISL